MEIRLRNSVRRKVRDMEKQKLNLESELLITPMSRHVPGAKKPEGRGWLRERTFAMLAHPISYPVCWSLPSNCLGCSAIRAVRKPTETTSVVLVQVKHPDSYSVHPIVAALLFFKTPKMASLASVNVEGGLIKEDI